MTRNVMTTILAGLLAACASPVWAARAQNADFESMPPMSYTGMLRDANNAYADKRYDKAFTLFQRSACAGDKESQSAIGRMYLLGQGVKREDLVGYAWLKVAAQVRDLGYQKIVDELEHAMTSAQRPIADQLGKRAIDLYGLAATHMSCQPYASRGGHILDTIMCTPERNGTEVLLRRCVPGALP
jgi:TPR repeat protein